MVLPKEMFVGEPLPLFAGSTCPAVWVADTCSVPLALAESGAQVLSPRRKVVAVGVFVPSLGSGTVPDARLEAFSPVMVAPSTFAPLMPPATLAFVTQPTFFPAFFYPPLNSI